MAKQTIIVMSDSHGDRSIVEAIKEKYLGQVDGIFHNGDSELKSDDPVWEGIHVVQGNMDFYDGYPERLVYPTEGQHGSSRPTDIFSRSILVSKLDLLGPRGGSRYLSLRPPSYPRCLEGRKNPLCESWIR